MDRYTFFASILLVIFKVRGVAPGGGGGGGNTYLKACRKFKIKSLCDHFTKTEITAFFYGNPKQYLNGQI